MEAVKFEAKASGGYVRVHRIEDNKSTVIGSFNSRTVADNIARQLNLAFADGAQAGRDSVADMLDSRFERGGLGGYQYGWRAAAEAARQHTV